MKATRTAQGKIRHLFLMLISASTLYILLVSPALASLCTPFSQGKYKLVDIEVVRNIIENSEDTEQQEIGLNM